MLWYPNINGNIVQFTAAEETAKDPEETAWANATLDREQSNIRSKRDALLT